MKKSLPVIVVTLLGLILLGIKVYPDIKGYFASNNQHTIPTNNESNSESNETDSDSTNQEVKHRDPSLATTFPFNSY